MKFIPENIFPSTAFAYFEKTAKQIGHLTKHQNTIEWSTWFTDNILKHVHQKMKVLL